MSYNVLVKEAYRLIDDVPRDKIAQVVVVLRDMHALFSESYVGERRMPDRESLHSRIMGYAGCLPTDIDEKSVLKASRELKYGCPA